MARKSAVMLKKVKVTLPQSSLAFIAQVKALSHEGAEEQHKRCVLACQELEEQWVCVSEISKLVDKKGSSDPNWPAYLTAHADLTRAQAKAFSSCDGFMYALKHAHDDVLVSEEDIRATVIDSLADKLDELQFTLKTGLLGSKVAQAIRAFAIEADMGEPPICADCQEQEA